MDITDCPGCGTSDIRLEVTSTTFHTVDSWRSGDQRPVFVASGDILESQSTQRIACVNGHAHPDRVGFDLEWTKEP